MDTFLIFLEFLLNNALIVTVMTLATFLTFYLIHRAYKELRINYKLRRFQNHLRNLTTKPNQKRIAVISLRVFAPVVIVFLILQVTLMPSPEYDYHMTQLDSAQDIESIHEYYHQKFSMQISLRSAAQEVGSTTLAEDSIQISAEPMMDTLKSDGEFIYYLHENGLTVITPEDSTNPVNHKITEPFIDILDFSPKALYVEGSNIVVIGTGSQNNVSMLEDLDDDNDINTYIVIFEKNETFTLENTYIVNGEFLDAHKHDANLLVTTEHSIIVDEGLDYSLPEVENNGLVHKTVYSDIYYIEGTKPEVFISILQIDLDNKTTNQKVIYSDSENRILFSEGDIFFVSESLLFYEATEMFIMSEPIARVRTAITKFSIDNGELSYDITKLINGTSLDNVSIDVTLNEIRLITIDHSSNTKHHLYVLDLYLETKHVIYDLDFNGAKVIASTYFGPHVYFITDQVENNLYVMDYTDINTPTLTNVSTIKQFSSVVAQYDESHLIGIKYTSINSNNGPVDGLRISLYDVTNPLEPVEIFFETVALSDFGYNLSDVPKTQKPFILSVEHNKLILSINTGENTSGNIQEAVLVFDVSYNSGFTVSSIESVQAPIVYDANRVIILDNHLYIIFYDDVHVFTLENFINPIYQFNIE